MKKDVAVWLLVWLVAMVACSAVGYAYTTYVVLKTSKGYFVVAEGPDGMPVTTEAALQDLTGRVPPVDPDDDNDDGDNDDNDDNDDGEDGEDLPDGRFGLAPLTRQLATTLVEDKHRSAAAKLTDAYAIVVEQASDDSFENVQQMVTVQKGVNANVLKMENIPTKSWKPFFTALGKALSDLQRSGKLKTTIKDHIIAWEEIAMGLDAVK